MNVLLNGLRDLVTEPDGKTHDLVRWIAAIGSLHGFALVGYDVIFQHAHFDIQQYGIGFGAMLAGVGAALKMKPNSTSPE